MRTYPTITSRASRLGTLAEPAPSRSKSGWFPLQLLLLLLGALLIPAQLYVAIPLHTDFADSFSVPVGVSALAVSTFGAAYAVGFAAFGPLSDRLGRSTVLAIGCLVLALATVGAAIARNWESFLFARTVQGLAAATFAPAALASVAELANVRIRPLALSLVTTGLLGAGLAGQIAGEASSHSWRMVFWGCAVAYIVLALAFTAALPRRAPGHADVSLAAQYAEMVRLLAVGRVRTVFVASLAVFSSFVGWYSSLGAYLRVNYGYDAHTMLEIELVGALGLLAGPASHRLARLRGPRFLAILGLVAAAGSMAMGLITAHPLVPIIASVPFVAGISLVVPGVVGLLSAHFSHQRGAAISVNTFMLFVGAALAPAISTALSYQAALVTFTAMLLAAAALVAYGTHQPHRTDFRS
jgi:MFS transporter, YNFM family, putative membrane transport protein